MSWGCAQCGKPSGTDAVAPVQIKVDGLWMYFDTAQCGITWFADRLGYRVWIQT